MIGLALLYSGHLLATGVWVAALAGALLSFPHEAEAPPWEALWQRHRRIDLALWAALVALWATGMFQMSASEQYAGFLQVRGLWATVLFVKHLVIFAILGLTAYHSLALVPALRRQAWKARRHAAAATHDPHLLPRVRHWAYAQTALAVVVLLLTAVLRASA